MDIKGKHRFQAPRDRVWDALLDPQILAQALPGGEDLHEVGENEYSAVMNVRVGPVQGKFSGKIQLSEIDPPNGYQMDVDGSGTAGFVQGVGTLKLQEDGDETVLDYAGEVQVGGRLASVGQRLIESTAKSLIRQGLRALDTQLQPSAAPPAAKPAPSKPAAVQTPPSPPPTPAKDTAATPTGQTPAPQTSTGQATGPSAVSIAAEVAKDVARDLASDYVSPSRQDKIAYALLGAFLMLLFVILVRLVQRN